MLIDSGTIRFGRYKNTYQYKHEINWKSRELSLEVIHFREHPSLKIGLIFATFYIGLPMFLHRPVPPDDYQNMLYNYGFSWHFSGYRGDLFLHWKDKCKIIHMPWDWQHVRHDILIQDKTWRRVSERFGPGDEDAPWNWTDKYQEQHPYTYTLKNGKVQNVTATIGVEEREWRWRWFTWLPWPRKIHRTIEVKFSDEVGERSGSWKGGCVGCGYDMKSGESPLECLRRMEKERVFK